MEIFALNTGITHEFTDKRSSGLAVKDGNTVALFDCGPDLPDVLEGSGIDLLQIKHIYLSHPHGDHIGGIVKLADLLRGAAREAGRSLRVFLWGPREVVVWTVERLAGDFCGSGAATVEFLPGDLESGIFKIFPVDHCGKPAAATLYTAPSSLKFFYSGDYGQASDLQSIILQCRDVSAGYSEATNGFSPPDSKHANLQTAIDLLNSLPHNGGEVVKIMGHVRKDTDEVRRYCAQNRINCPYNGEVISVKKGPA